MINAVWQGRILDVDEVAQTEEFETMIRKAGKNHELKCTDPHCKCYVGYKHGPKRKPHFFHIGESDCEYAKFEKQDTPIKKEIRQVLYNHFISLGYDIQREIRIPNSRKYCDLLFNLDNQNLALFILLSTTSVNYVEKIIKECEQNNCKPLWISVGDPYDIHREKDHYFAMRYQFNHTINKNLLIIDNIASTVAQIKEDDRSYEYKRQVLNSRYFSGNIKNFQSIKPVNTLRVIENELTIDSFPEDYRKWIESKNNAFEAMKSDIDSWMQNSQKDSIQIKDRIQQDIQQSFSQESPVVTPPIVIGDYKVGSEIKHILYGFGTIIEINTIPNSSRHITKIQYRNGEINSCELEITIRKNIIKIAKQ